MRKTDLSSEIVFCLLIVFLFGAQRSSAYETRFVPKDNPVQCDVINDNPIQCENRQPGTATWRITPDHEAFDNKTEGYASATSVNVGEPITFYVNVKDSASFDIEIYRMGYYQGLGGRLIHTAQNLTGIHQPYDEANHQTGLIEMNWAASYTWTPSASVVNGMFTTASGNFVAKLKGSAKCGAGGGNICESYIPFVVRDDNRCKTNGLCSDFLFQTSVTTYQAYNLAPYAQYDSVNGQNVLSWRTGHSLYKTICPKSPCPILIPEQSVASVIQDEQARMVSFNRPYQPDNNNIYLSAGQFFQWEYNMVRWMEGEGYDVRYQTDIDTHQRSGTISGLKHKVFLSVGHDEYWTWEMRDNLEKARDSVTAPLSIGFFSGNTMHWQIRLADSSIDSAPGVTPNRTIIGYKQHINDSSFGDPVTYDSDQTNNYLTTGYWHNQADFGGTCPANRLNCHKEQEDALLGVQTDLNNVAGGNQNFILDANCPQWIKNGVLMPAGGFPGIVGYEADRIFPEHVQTDRTTWVAGNSPFNPLPPPDDPNDPPQPPRVSNAVYYKMNANGARVFSAGTIQWAWGLDAFGSDIYPLGSPDPIHLNYSNTGFKAMTHNILRCLRDGGAACGEPVPKGSARKAVRKPRPKARMFR